MVSAPAGARQVRWAYAAAFGAAWGSLEIVVGSFLHATHVPLTGPILATAGAALLVAERQLVTARGVCLATGLVAAACKSLSPGGVILAPMLGIAGEAALVELALLVAPRRAGSAALAGLLASWFPVAQKLLMQLVLYGTGILTLYTAAIRRVAQWLGGGPGLGWVLVAGAAAALGVVGATGGVLGLRAGRECRRLLDRKGRAA